MDYQQPITIYKLKELFEQEEPNVSSTIAPEDGMYAGNRDHYFHVGQSSLRCIKLALLTAGNVDIKRILDLPCGHGRVLRTLKAAFPEAELTACDMLKDGVDFCATEFGAIPVYSQAQPTEIELQGSFDLIWCGSLLTHLGADRWPGFLNLFNAHLSAGGLAIFTTHGRWVADRMRRGEVDYGLMPDQLKKLLDGYYQEGFGYGNYFHSTDYGVSVSSPTWVCSQLSNFPNVRLLNFHERGWDNHQDVIAFTLDS